MLWPPNRGILASSREVRVLPHLWRVKRRHDVFTRNAFAHEVIGYAVFGCILLNPNLAIAQPNVEMGVEGALAFFPSQ